MLDRNFDVLVTHANCSDGTTCALLAKAYNYSRGKDLKIIFAKYGNEEEIIKQIPIGGHVLFTDFTMSLESMNHVDDITASLVVLDHHKTAEAVLKDKDYAVFDMDKCGAMLTHDWLYGDDVEAPMMVKYVCDRDLWKFNYTSTVPFSAGYHTYKVKDLLEMDSEYIFGEEFIIDCVNKGIVLTDAQTTKTATIVSRTNDPQTLTLITPEGRFRMWCINNSEYISETGNSLAMKQRTDGLVYNASVQYFITENEIVLSLRSVEDVDVGTIAKAFGGGGHEKAAGCSVPLTKFVHKDGFRKLLLDKELDYVDFI